MKLASPSVGDVVHYSYLWADQHRRGEDAGRKDRPVAVLALAVQEDSGHRRLFVLPITHHPPTVDTDAVLLAPHEKHKLGLDDLASWVVTTEANVFTWPGPDVRSIPDRNPDTVLYGRLPRGTMSRIAQSYLQNRERQRAQTVRRTD